MSVTLTTDGRVATITIDRPETRNGMTREMWDELLGHLQALEHDADIGCVVLTGTGKAFCAGGDVKAMVRRLEDDATPSIALETRNLRRMMECGRLLHEMPKPTIAAINGACAGAGLALALACDFRLVNVEAKMATAFANVGLSGDFGGSWFLSKIVGTAKARELYYFSPVFTGRMAEDMGIAHRAYLPDDLMEAAYDWANQLAAGPSTAIAYMKQNMNSAESCSLSDALDREAQNMVLSFQTEDHREAARAFLEKREPTFKGR